MPYCETCKEVILSPKKYDEFKNRVFMTILRTHQGAGHTIDYSRYPDSKTLVWIMRKQCRRRRRRKKPRDMVVCGSKIIITKETEKKL